MKEKDFLYQFSERVMVEIAMNADIQEVSDRATYDRWFHALHQAVDDGLEDALKRAYSNPVELPIEP